MGQRDFADAAEDAFVELYRKFRKNFGILIPFGQIAGIWEIASAYADMFEEKQILQKIMREHWVFAVSVMVSYSVLWLMVNHWANEQASRFQSRAGGDQR
ncbi:MAG: hypothetical protein ACRC67_09520 [Inquilinus sp.]|uniref:hypothetical protein n=1 Tax=Inquilinus sp. TaxID=1932117 RepID=UPI003F2B66CB